MLTQNEFLMITTAIDSRQNILIAGPTGSGKTTLCNAILKAIVDNFPDERLIILKDTSELIVRATDILQR